MASLIQKADDGVLGVASDFIRNFKEGLTSVETTLKTLSQSTLDTKNEFVLDTLQISACSTEKYFREAANSLDASIHFFQNESCMLLESDKELRGNIENLAQSIKEEKRNIENFQNQLTQCEREKDNAERKLQDTMEKLMSLERQKNSMPLRAAASGTMGILVGSLLLGPVGGMLAVGINGALFFAEVNSLKNKIAEYESYFKSHVDIISDLYSTMLEAKVKMFGNEIKMHLLDLQSKLSTHLLEKNRENSRALACIKETLKKFTNSISRIHSTSKVVLIESEEIYDFKNLINSLIALGTAIEAVMPDQGISNRLKDLSKRANSCKMLDSEFSF